MSLLVIMMTAFVSVNLVSCGDDELEEEKVGSIYGIATELGTAEPMKAVGVELYKGSALLLKTVTFDDGHFEFKELEPGDYKVNVVADGYEEAKGDVVVEAGRQARIDLQIKKLQTHMVVRTTEVTIAGTKVTLTGEYTYESGYSPSEVGIMYATHENPKNGGELLKGKLDNTAKTISVTIEDLAKGTYYYQAYATNKVGKAYGEVRSFNMIFEPVITTLHPTNILSTTATLNGRIDAEGDPAYTKRGFVYSKLFPRPTIDDPEDATTKVVVPGRSKDFSANISTLTLNEKYYVRAYATNENGTVYGEVMSFKAGVTEYVIIDNLMIQKQDLGTGDWSTATQMCANSRVGGFSDWRLPTLAELSLMYTHRTEIGGFKSAYYWSSSRSSSSNYYWAYVFSSGIQNDMYSSNKYYVRAVRTVN